MNFYYIDDIYSHAHGSTLCKNSRPIGGRNECKTDLDCLENARKKCDEDSSCHGIAWFQFRKEQPLKICNSRETQTKSGWRTMWKKDGISFFVQLLTYLFMKIKIFS